MFLIFDTETTGLPKRWNAPVSDSNNWPRCVQLAWQLHDETGKCLEYKNYLIKPNGFEIPFAAEKVHGISTELAQKKGTELKEVLDNFKNILSNTKYLCGHNIVFDINILSSEYYRYYNVDPLKNFPKIDTCNQETANICMLPGGKGGNYKFPTLSELHFKIFGKNFNEAHNASADVDATARCLFELLRTKKISPFELEDKENIYNKIAGQNPNIIEPLGIVHRNLKEESKKIKSKKSIEKNLVNNETNIKLNSSYFVHLHNRSQFSVLQSTSKIIKLIGAAEKHKMPAIAITDNSNLMGSFHFIKALNLRNKEYDLNSKIKPIIGCEFNICDNHKDKSVRDNGYQVLFIAKNKNGYNNLSKMSSIANIDGFYYVPRIDKSIVEKYKDDLIVLSGSSYGEIASKILKYGEKDAEESIEWWYEKFKDDFYLEVMRHGEEQEEIINSSLIKFSKKYKIKLIATNNTYYVEKEEANAHDILLCLKDGEKQSTPIGQGRGFRYGLPNQEYYLKSPEQMITLFEDLPEAISNIKELVKKIDFFDLKREVLLPKFKIPNRFLDENKDKINDIENAYLRHLTYIGAKRRYSKLNDEIKSRIDFELKVISNTGYPGYFLIVQDLISEARKTGVSVGPGRGSAAGSVVAYSLGIVNLDPIKYNLLFERFLNPDRVSLPDIDIDFDDEGRSKVLDYVIKKYGSNQVAQIITYGRMAAKSSIRDTARVLDLSLGEADRISKLIPNIKLSDLFKSTDSELKEILRTDEHNNVREIINISKGTSLASDTINQAKLLEGTLRNTGIHACGVIITPDNITNFVPITRAKDSNLYVTQFDNSVVEEAGLLKMDFLGLKTLTVIKDTVKLIKYIHELNLDPDSFPINDKKTYELFQRGDTVGVFQYESPGMQKYLKDLKPNKFDDLIAMNALYRPGPLEYIPSFVARKNGNEKIKYDLPVMEEFLEETYGITVYQEQVMLLSQKIANFSKGDADLLRKAMGKKIFDLLEKLKPKFIKGGIKNGHTEEILTKIWKDWEAFASYAFNKSHSTCYAWIGYQTAYLKANYPAEYMAAVLSNNMSDIKQVTFFMEECRRMGLNVLGPDVNESFYKFTVNKKQQIRFGMGAIKGVGQYAVETIIKNRKESNYKSIFDLTKKIDLRTANKKALENLALAGALDSFNDSHRAQYFVEDGDGSIFIEKAIKYGSKYQQNLNSSQTNLFGDENSFEVSEITLPQCDLWPSLVKLKREKEVVGIYISGHPLDAFHREIKYFTSTSLSELSNLNEIINKEIIVGGIINEVVHLKTRNGKSWAKFILEDYRDQYEFRIFSEEYLRFRHFLIENQFIRLKFYVKEGWVNKETGKRGEPYIQYNSFELLQDTINTNSKKITIKIDINNLNDSSIENLKEVIEKNKGTQSLFFDIMELSEEIKITSLSRKNKVSITNKFLNVLEKEEIDYKLN